MKVVLTFLLLACVGAQLPPDNPPPPGSSNSKPSSDSSADSGASGSSSANSWPSGSGSFGDAGFPGTSNSGASGSGWVDWGWDGSNGWDPTKELWHFRPPWNWDSPSPPQGTMYLENWGIPPTPVIPSRRSFNFAADKGVSLVGASEEEEGGHSDCKWRTWCVHLTFHSSYGVLSDFDAFVLDRYDSAQRVYGNAFWYGREGDEGPPKAFAPMVLGGFSPDEKSVLSNISSWRVEEKARRFNETRTTTWTLYPESDEMDVVLSFKQLYTLLPGYPDGNMTQYALNSEVLSEWGSADQVLLRVIAKRQEGGFTSVLMPRVLNFTGSQLFQVEYFSSLEYPQEEDNLTGGANGLTLDVIFGRRRYGSGLPWNPARPSDVCDACNQQVMNHPMVARCLHGHVPESIFKNIYEEASNEQLDWDRGEWDQDYTKTPSNFTFYLNDVVDACFGLRWLLNGKVDGGSWSSDWSGDGDRRSSSGSGFGDAGYGWSDTTSGSNGNYNNDGSGFREPVYRYDDSGSRWSSWGYKDVGSASKFADAGSRGSSSGSAGDPNAGDWPNVRDLMAALSITRETDAGIQCFVESRCPVGSRNFAEAAGRMVVLEHEHAFVRVDFTDPNYKFYMWMELEGLGSEGQFTTPELSSEHSPEEIAELVAGAVPNASDYNLAVDVRVFNNSDVIAWINMYNEWIKNYYNTGGSASEASTAWASYSASSSTSGSSFQFPPAGEESTFHSNFGPNSASMDGSSPNAGEESDGSGGSHSWWFTDPIPVPDPQFTVEISLRNVSVVPNILDVYVVSDESSGSAQTNTTMSWDARSSELRFQLSPLNLSTFEYVPPPPYVNLTWNEDTPEYPDLSGNGSNWDNDVWSVCSSCSDAFDACDNSTSCSLGVRAFLQEALSKNHFDPYVISNDTDYNNRRPWGVDFGPRLRQSAAFFTLEGYELFMNFMICLSKNSCDLDTPRQAYSYTKGDYHSAEPTLLQIEPAQSLFAVPRHSDGGENIVMKYRGKEYSFEWDGVSNYIDAMRLFVDNVMNEYDADENLWTRNPSPQYSWTRLREAEQDGVPDTIVISVEFWDNYFIESEQPRFRPVSSDNYNEINSTHWKAMAVAYRNPEDESFWDDYSDVMWRNLSSWLLDLSYDPEFNDYMHNFGNFTSDDVPICHQCMDIWTQCVTNQSCFDTMRSNVLPSFGNELYATARRSSLDVSAQLAALRMTTDLDVYNKIMKLLMCVNAASCPVGYAMPSDSVAPLVPVTLKLASHFAVTLPVGKALVAFYKGDSFDFKSQLSSANELESWLRSLMKDEFQVDVQASDQDAFVRFDVSYYPSASDFPTFYLRDDQTPFTLEETKTFASFQLSSNRVQYGQALSWDLLQYWFGLNGDGWRLFYYFGDIFSGYQVCHGCPACWEALTRCQNDMDCAVSTREVLAPLLQNATLPLSTSTRTDGRVEVKLDLSSALLSLKNEAFQSREGWLAFVQLLHSLDSCDCEVGFDQWTSDMKNLDPTRMSIDSEAVELSVRLYPGTQLDVWFNGNSFTYDVQSSTPMDAANSFMNWFKPIANAEPFYLGAEQVDVTIDDNSQSALLIINMFGLSNDASDSKTLVNPSWIPTFVVTTSDVSFMPPAEVIVTPWKISLQSVDRYPPFDRLVDLLKYGAVSDEFPSPGSNSSYAGSMGSYSGGSYSGGPYSGGSVAGDECSKCSDLRQMCFDDVECRQTVIDKVISNLQRLGSWPRTDGSYYFDMSGQILDDVFYGMQSLPAKKKLLSLLTCSATKWTLPTGQDGASCIQKLAEETNPGGFASLDISEAKSVFPIRKGDQTMVNALNGDTLYYIDNGEASELVDFMENQVLGGYENSGVKVKVITDLDSGTYTVLYDGLTALSTPFIEGQTFGITMQFMFSASTPDLRLAFNPWMYWLTPSKPV